MLFGTVGQLRVFVWMAAAGAVIGAWYGCAALWRRLLSAGFWLGLAADTAFGLGAAAIFCLALYAANYGQVRLYAVAASALGFAIFALGAFPVGRRAIQGTKWMLHRIIVTLSGYRWIKVIFR